MSFDEKQLDAYAKWLKKALKSTAATKLGVSLKDIVPKGKKLELRFSSKSLPPEAAEDVIHDLARDVVAELTDAHTELRRVGFTVTVV